MYLGEDRIVSQNLITKICVDSIKEETEQYLRRSSIHNPCRQHSLFGDFSGKTKHQIFTPVEEIEIQRLENLLSMIKFQLRELTYQQNFWSIRLFGQLNVTFERLSGGLGFVLVVGLGYLGNWIFS